MRLDGLTGLYGAYALLNSPHKLSTYLAGGLPVIVAKNAAAADFVAREQVGVVLNSLRELPELIRTMPEEDYQRYAANARRVGALSTAMPAHRPAKSEKTKIPPTTIQRIRLDGHFLTGISC